MFLGCFLAMIRLLLLVFRWFVVVLDLGKSDFDSTKKHLHTSWVLQCMLVHGCGRGCMFLVSWVCLVLIVRGGVTVIRLAVTVLFFPGLVLGDLEMRRPSSPGLHG